MNNTKKTVNDECVANQSNQSFERRPMSAAPYNYKTHCPDSERELDFELAKKKVDAAKCQISAVTLL